MASLFPVQLVKALTLLTLRTELSPHNLVLQVSGDPKWRLELARFREPFGAHPRGPQAYTPTGDSLPTPSWRLPPVTAVFCRAADETRALRPQKKGDRAYIPNLRLSPPCY